FIEAKDTGADRRLHVKIAATQEGNLIEIEVGSESFGAMLQLVELVVEHDSERSKEIARLQRQGPVVLQRDRLGRCPRLAKEPAACVILGSFFAQVIARN